MGTNNNIIELSKVIELIQEVRKSTNDFYNGLKESLFIMKDGKMENPKNVLIGYIDKKYILEIEDYAFSLDDNGNLITVTEKSIESDNFLKLNIDVIINALKELQNNEPQYYVSSTNEENYMNFIIHRSNLKIEYNSNQLVIYAQLTNGWKKLSYKIFEDSILYSKQNKGTLSDSLTYDNSTIDDNIGKIIIKNTQINIDELPLILKTRLNNKKSLELK